MAKFEIDYSEKNNALGTWYDEHWDEIDAEWDEAEKRGEVYTLAELGAKDWIEGCKKMREMQANGTLGKFHAPPHSTTT